MAKGSIDDSLGHCDAHSRLSAMDNSHPLCSMVSIVRVPNGDTVGTRCLRWRLPCNGNILRGDRTKVRCHDGHSVYLHERDSGPRSTVRSCRREARNGHNHGNNRVPAVGGSGDQSGEDSVQERMRPQCVQEIQKIIRGRPGCQKFRRTVTVGHGMGVRRIGSIPTNQGHRNVVMTPPLVGRWRNVSYTPPPGSPPPSHRPAACGSRSTCRATAGLCPGPAPSAAVLSSSSFSYVLRTVLFYPALRCFLVVNHL